MADTREFNRLYKRLNSGQKMAVDTISGPVIVVAGPGTGKTLVLTLRIANILRLTDTVPDNILALTFTESGAHEMKKRLIEIVGSDAYRVRIQTFHSFCNDVIDSHPDSFPRIIGSSPGTEVDKIMLIEEVLENVALSKLRPFGNPHYYSRLISTTISSLKREYISPSEYTKYIASERKMFRSGDTFYTSGKNKGSIKGKFLPRDSLLKKSAELALVYSAYENLLQERKCYDYEDMIVEVVRALGENRDLLSELRETHQYLLADEHQDANSAQNRLLELLASFDDNPDLFVVGDEKQAIYRFQGASVENFSYFMNRFPKTKMIHLSENYRSAKSILDAAGKLKLKKSITIGERLVATIAGAKHGVSISMFRDIDQELFGVAHDVKKRIEGGVAGEEIAVLYRANNDAGGIAEALAKEGVNFNIESDEDVLADTEVSKLRGLLEAVDNFGDSRSLAVALHYDFLKIQEMDIYRALRYGRIKKLSLYETMASVKNLRSSGVSDARRMHELFDQLSRWKRVSQNEPAGMSLSQIAEESGFIRHVLSLPDSSEALLRVQGLYGEMSRYSYANESAKLHDFLEYLRLVREYEIRVRKDKSTSEKLGVRLMTAHKSKGREFDFVYVIGANDNHWGNRRQVSHFVLPASAYTKEDILDDERRLFYVALTRARSGVLLSYSNESRDGRALLPSEFVEELVESGTVKMPILSAKMANPVTMLAPARTHRGTSVSDKEYLNRLFVEQGLSVTALNNYLKCPWNYFYSNLVRIPKVQTKHMLFGDSVHKTLKRFFDEWARGKKVGRSTLTKYLIENLTHVPLSDSDYKEMKSKGVKALSGYYEKYHESWSRNIVNELRVETTLTTNLPILPKLVLRGDLDKLEKLGEGRDVNVVDYKTGKPRSRNDIEGKTKSSSGDYKRQLVFYKMLLALDERERYRVVSGQIDFIEPTASGTYRSERFEIDSGEVSDLQKLVTQTAEEIMNLSFWNTTCSERNCEYCNLRNLL